MSPPLALTIWGKFSYHQKKRVRKRRGQPMPKTRVVVTDAQVEAARMIVDHDKALGRETSEAIRKIAEAIPRVAESSTGN